MAQLEPWEKILIELKTGEESFAAIDPPHAVIGCVGCHGGLEPVESADFETAHDAANGFMRDPSENPNQFCVPCHADIVSRNATSMHSNLWGEQSSIAVRELGSGNDYQSFDACPVELTEGFDGECMNCHTTCGQCHVSRPNSAHGGFIDSHRFNKTPHQSDNCTACHGSRIGVDFKGELTGNKGDVHYLNWMTCFDCHSGNELHGDGQVYASRYEVPDLPKCLDCHDDVASDNTYHLMHWTDGGVLGELTCYVCHSQPYYNCSSCHTEGEWKPEDGLIEGDDDIHIGNGGYIEFPEFRIGYNYNTDLYDGEWIVVRHIPISRDSYEPWGHSELANYDDRPTWEYSSPHNIRRFTAQTDTTGGVDCSDNCHVKGDNSVINATRFLWQSFVDSAYADEAIANSQVVVDEHIPSSWEKF